jgi:hypothetical protein
VGTRHARVVQQILDDLGERRPDLR